MHIVFSLTIFLSALLLFLVQPMIGKMILPLLGGTPAVWITAMMFFQGMLLAGYLYAHLSAKYLSFKAQPILQILVLGFAVIALPIGFSDDMILPTGSDPALWLVGKLFLYVGLPFFALSANSPMLQHWFANTNHRLSHNPYFLYAASNLGSMIALLSYPFWVERSFDLSKQSDLWTSLYFVLIAVIILCAVITLKKLKPANENAASESEESGNLSIKRRFMWVCLAFVPSVMLLALTSYITANIAPFPLFWVIPLALYLLTFTIVFARKPIITVEQTNKVHFIVLLVFIIGGGLWFDQPGFASPLKYFFTVRSFLVLHLGLLFFTALLLHGRLVKDKPHPSKLTEFYLWISFGGFLGGVFSTLVAPHIFNDYYEYPLVIFLACLMRLPDKKDNRLNINDLAVFILLLALLLIASSIKPFMNEYLGYLFGFFKEKGFYQLIIIVLVLVFCLKSSARPSRLALCVAALILAPFITPLIIPAKDNKSTIIYQERSFFGVLKIKKTKKQHVFYHGAIPYGTQRLANGNVLKVRTRARRIGRFSGYLAIIESGTKKNKPIAILGLGIGKMACLGNEGQQFDFYEINPAVEEIATNPKYFTFLQDCPPETKVIMGDARIAIAKAPDNHYGLIVADAFNGMAVPTHLLTKEAISLYLKKLQKGGIIVFHISNKYLDLKKPLGRIAAEMGLTAILRAGPMFTIIAMTEDRKTLAPVFDLQLSDSKSNTKNKNKKNKRSWKVLRDYPETRLWTDTYTELGSLIRF